MLGGASIGCLFKEVKPDQARECIERAVEKGIRYVRAMLAHSSMSTLWHRVLLETGSKGCCSRVCRLTRHPGTEPVLARRALVRRCPQGRTSRFRRNAVVSFFPSDRSRSSKTTTLRKTTRDISIRTITTSTVCAGPTPAMASASHRASQPHGCNAKSSTACACTTLKIKNASPRPPLQVEHAASAQPSLLHEAVAWLNCLRICMCMSISRRCGRDNDCSESRGQSEGNLTRNEQRAVHRCVSQEVPGKIRQHYVRKSLRQSTRRQPHMLSRFVAQHLALLLVALLH